MNNSANIIELFTTMFVKYNPCSSKTDYNLFLEEFKNISFNLINKHNIKTLSIDNDKNDIFIYFPALIRKIDTRKLKDISNSIIDYQLQKGNISYGKYLRTQDQGLFKFIKASEYRVRDEA